MSVQFFGGLTMYVVASHTCYWRASPWPWQSNPWPLRFDDFIIGYCCLDSFRSVSLLFRAV